eukprot:6177366-Pleurochrysis_carterae.AAC.1
MPRGRRRRATVDSYRREAPKVGGDGKRGGHVERPTCAPALGPRAAVLAKDEAVDDQDEEQHHPLDTGGDDRASGEAKRQAADGDAKH